MITLSVRPGFPGRIAQAAIRNQFLDFDGLDLDLTTPASLYASRVFKGSLFGQRQEVRTMWFSTEVLLTAAREPAQRGIKRVHDLLSELGPTLLVSRLPDSTGSELDQSSIVALERFAELVQVRERAVAVPALAGGAERAHLNRLRLLRRHAEEWDVGIMVDFGPRSSREWEAEAAVQILGERLTGIRFRTSPIPIYGDGADVALRCLRACLDSGFRGVISLAPATPWFLRWHGPTVDRDLSLSIDFIRRLTSLQRAIEYERKQAETR